MEIQKNKSIFELIVIFILLLTANVSAFFRVLWLIPKLVFVQTTIFILISGLVIWYLVKENALSSVVKNLKSNWFIFPFLFFAFLSVFWSIQKDITLIRSVMLFCTVFIGTAIGIRKSIKELLLILSIFSILILVLSVAIIIFFPSFGIMHYSIIQGAWAGIFWHKNHLGAITALTSIIFFINFVEKFNSKDLTRYFWGAMYIVSIYILIKTDSVGGYLSVIFVHGLYIFLLLWLKFRQSLKKSHYIFAGIIILILFILVFTNLDIVFGMFNRNTSLTGRIPMWSYLFDTYLSQKPYLGFGFNAFWYNLSHRIDMGIAAGYPDPIVIADNGFIDILINTGIIGFALFGLFYFGMWFRVTQLALQTTKSIDFVPLIILAFTFIGNLSWSIIFENENFFMIIMVIGAFIATKQLKGNIIDIQ